MHFFYFVDDKPAPVATLPLLPEVKMKEAEFIHRFVNMYPGANHHNIEVQVHVDSSRNQVLFRSQNPDYEYEFEAKLT